MSNKIIAANFKMNLSSKDEAINLCKYYQQKDQELPNVDFIAAPDFLWLEDIVGLGVSVSSQDCFFEDAGPFTGEISPMILKNIGVKYCIVGHSERRNLGDTDEIVNKKIKAVIKNGIIPILCVGETLEQKQSGQKDEALRGQIMTALEDVVDDSISLIVAYEPVWAIGTGISATPEQAEEVHSQIRSALRVLFGEKGNNVLISLLFLNTFIFIRPFIISLSMFFGTAPFTETSVNTELKPAGALYGEKVCGKPIL